MNLFTPKTIRKTRNNLQPKVSILKSLFFPDSNDIFSETEEIILDLRKNNNVMAPVVSPIENGRVVKEKAVKSNIITAPNIAPKYVMTAKDIFRRYEGESLEGFVGRQSQRLSNIMTGQEGYIVNREEYMIGQLLSAGKVTSTSKDHKFEFDYQANAKIILAAADKFTADTSNPLAKIDELVDTAEESGNKVNVIVMGREAGAAFKTNKNVIEQLNQRKITRLEDGTRAVTAGVTYIGNYLDKDVDLYIVNVKVSTTDSSSTLDLIPSEMMVGGPNNGETIYAPVVWFKADGSDDVVFNKKRVSNMLVTDGKQKSVVTESRPVLNPCDLASYIIAEVV